MGTSLPSPASMAFALALIGGFALVSGLGVPSARERPPALRTLGLLMLAWALRLVMHEPLAPGLPRWLPSVVDIAAAALLLALAHAAVRRAGPEGVGAGLVALVALAAAALVLRPFGDQRGLPLRLLADAVELTAALALALSALRRLRRPPPAALPRAVMPTLSLSLPGAMTPPPPPSTALPRSTMPPPAAQSDVPLPFAPLPSPPVTSSSPISFASPAPPAPPSTTLHGAVDLQREVEQLAQARIVQVTDRERKRIAADLHDDLGAKLLTIVHTSGDERISTLAREALAEMRLSVRGLTGRPVRLADALGDWRAEVIARLGQAGIQAEWLAPGDDDVPHTLSARACVQTTRVLREAISNVIRHSGASQCTVRCAIADDDFQLVVQDNGRGIAIERDGRLDKGHGMASMKARAKQLRGQCLVESSAGRGTVIRLTLPLSASLDDTLPPPPSA